MSGDTLTIDAPIGYINDTVLALNYRMRPGNWEPATIVEVTFRPAQTLKRRDGSTYEWPAKWTYRVWVERPRIESKSKYGRTRGGGYAIEVGSDGVRRHGVRQPK